MSEKELNLESSKGRNCPFVCQECNLGFRQKRNFQMHCLTHNNKQSFVCKICNESFHFMSHHQRHCLLKHAQVPPLCVEESKLEDDHINVQSLESVLISKEPFICDESDVKNTDIHKGSLTNPEQNQFVCSVCNKEFIHKNDYNAHCKIHFNIKAPKNTGFACEVCQQTCSTKRDLARHLKKHNYACVTYGKDSNAKEVVEVLKNMTGLEDSHIKGVKHLNTAQCKNLKDTVEVEHFKDKAGRKEFNGKVGKKDLTAKTGNKDKPRKKKASSEEFTCGECNKSYKLKIAFMSHKMSHVAARPVCEVCHKQFASNKLLKLHFRRHSDVRFFFCELCNKGFKHKHHLRAHFITHTDEHPFVCEVCNKGYKHKWGLRQHELAMHPKELPFVCKVCGQGFKQGWDLDTHLSSHVLETSEADDCGQENKTFTAKDEPK